EVQAAWAAHQAYVENWERREEVGRFKEGLRGLGLTLPDLVRVCPRHRDARKRALAVAQYLARHPELGREALARREIPMRELQAQLNVGRKALERNRKYILAMTLVLMGDYPYLQDYLRS
ncbi:MAG TPA: RNA polymerase subunit sigma, partial [Firmicutes bacterium]|nr:RNA polymerase subunit sigma [Bacillota bacterium]